MLQSMGWQRVGHDLATEQQQIADSLHCTAKTQHYEANTSQPEHKSTSALSPFITLIPADRAPYLCAGGLPGSSQKYLLEPNLY